MAADPTRVNWDVCTLEKITEMVSRRVCVDRETGATIVQTHLRKGAIVSLHVHAGEQAVQVSQGNILIRIGHKECTLQAGDRVTIPTLVPHQLEALDDSVVIDVRLGDASFSNDGLTG